MNKKISILLKVLFTLVNIGVFLFSFFFLVIGVGISHYKIHLHKILPYIAIMIVPLFVLFAGHKKGFLPKVVFISITAILLILLLLFAIYFIDNQWFWLFGNQPTSF